MTARTANIKKKMRKIKKNVDKAGGL